MTDEELKALEAHEMIKAVYEDGEAEINGRVYKLTKTTHKKRRKIFSFFTSIEQGTFSFLETAEFEDVEKIISDIILFEGDLLSRLPDHWENYPEDYILFVSTMMGALSYPFLKGAVGSSK